MWKDGVREQAAAHGGTGKVERMDRMSREVTRIDADTKALAAAKESKCETRLEVRQAEARARVTSLAGVKAYAEA